MLHWYLLLALALLVLIIVFTPLRLSLDYRRDGMKNQDYLRIEISAWFRLVRFQYEIPVVKLLTDKKEPALLLEVEGQEKAKQMNFSMSDMKQRLQTFKQLREHVHDLQGILRTMMRKMRCEEFVWHTRLGFGEAASTGALSGLVWGIKSAIVTCFSHYISLRAVPRLSVQPVWNDEVIESQFRCILRFQLIHVLVAAARILFQLWSRRKGKGRHIFRPEHQRLRPYDG